MFRLRRNRGLGERPEGPSATRGSIGSARVWDARTRALRTSGGDALAEETPGLAALSPELVASIVQMTLETCLPAGARERAQVEDALRARLGALLDPAPHAPGAEASASTAPIESDSEPDAASAEEPGGPLLFADLPREQRALALVLDDRLGRVGGPLAERTDLRRTLILLALESRPRTPGAPPASQDELADLDLLQRRVSKLQGALREAKSALEMVARMEHVDTGVASIYRAVQGLDPRDPRQQCKQGLLKQVFEANLDLQGKREA